MQEVIINGNRRFCFMVKKGEVNNIVVPYDGLAPIDLKRFQEMEAKGGELMRVMRDTQLDNGVNALIQYDDVMVTVPVNIAVEEDEVLDEDEEHIQKTKKKTSKKKSKKKAKKKVARKSAPRTS